VISANGAAARRVSSGDIIFICAYAQLSEIEQVNFKPTLVRRPSEPR
jgi:aspartate 1-decarboxylase